MLTNTGTRGSVFPVRSRRSIAVVSKRPDRHVLDTVLKSTDYDVVLIESFGEAYSQIKKLAPQIVIVCLDPSDFDGVQVLSMLHVDADTAHIPVVTYLATPESASDQESGEDDEAESSMELVNSEDSFELPDEFVHHLLLRTMN